MRAEEAGARHDVGAHQRRRDERREARLERALEAEVHERDLEPRADALEEVEARAADLGAALHVDGVEQLAELEVVARLGKGRANVGFSPTSRSVTKSSSPPAGTPSMHDVLDAADVWANVGLGIVRGGLQSPSPGRRATCAWATSAAFSSLGAAATRLAERVLLGAHRLERGDRGAAGDVGGDAPRRRVATGAPRSCCERAHDVGVLAEQLRVDHALHPMDARSADALA